MRRYEHRGVVHAPDDDNSDGIIQGRWALCEGEVSIYGSMALNPVHDVPVTCVACLAMMLTNPARFR